MGSIIIFSTLTSEFRVSDLSSFSSTWSASGTLPTDEKFTGQRLDSTGLYYFGARYYDANIGRFISADTVIQDYNNPQTLNRYSYCTNNPLRYIDPTGHSTFDDIAGAFDTVDQWLASPIPGIDDAINNVPNAIGYEGQLSPLNTDLANNVPVIDVRTGSLLDSVMPSQTVTIYPVGVFTNDPMSLATQKEEGYHWNQQSSYGPLLPLWYGQYISEYTFYMAASGGDAGYAHDAVSFEQDAMGYAESIWGTYP